MKRRQQSEAPPAFGVLLAMALGGWGCAPHVARDLHASQSYVITAQYPHDEKAFTQGLLYHEGRLFESTGLYGESTLREVELQTGRPLRRRDLPHRYFGEGIALWSNRLYQLTWLENVLFVYDVNTFELIGSYEWPGEGWGLTVWSNRLVASDGSPFLRFYDPENLSYLGKIEVRYKNRPLWRLNELETVGNEIFANIFYESRVARIDPSTGEVVGFLDFSRLLPRELQGRRDSVMNGIAYDAAGQRLFLTGKNWPVLYEVRLLR